MKNLAAIAKTIAGVIGVTITALAPYYGHAKWFAALPAVATALAVWYLPNKPATPKA